MKFELRIITNNNKQSFARNHFSNAIIYYYFQIRHNDTTLTTPDQVNQSNCLLTTCG